MEPNRANVLSVDVLEAVAVAMVRCREELGVALLEAESEVDRTMVWVERDRVPHWKKRLQRTELDIQEARSALFRKENYRASSDSKPTVVDERKALAKAQAVHEDAERRARASHRWGHELPRQHAEYRRGVNPLAVMVDRELPQAIAALRRMMVALERYRGEQVIDLRSLLPEDSKQDASGSMLRDVDPPDSETGSP